MTTLFAITGKNIRGVRELTDAEVARYDRAVDAIQGFQRTQQIFELCRGNSREFLRFVAQKRASPPEVRRARGAIREHQALALNINRKLINYLASARLYLDNYELRLKRQYGRDSPEVVRFKEETARSYDGEFAYRFLYRLRNYGQHFGLPIEGIRAAGSTDRPGGDAIFELTVAVNARLLAREGKDLWSSVLPELEAGPDMLDVEPLVSTFHAGLERVNSAMIEAELERLRGFGQDLADLLGEVQLAGADATVGEIAVEGERVDLQLKDPPLAVLRELGLTQFEVQVPKSTGQS